jgi:Transposase DDE domain/Transposase domain (DUF772)
MLRSTRLSGEVEAMSLGRSPNQEDLHRSTRAACEARLGPKAIERLLARECHRLFPDEEFTDLFAAIGRDSVPPRIVAVVMVLQRLRGLSDREAVDAFAFDLRWKYAAGALDFDHPGFAHTVLVDMRERLRRSARPNRIFEAALAVAKQAGLVGRKRVLDSTALYDAVATQDTVTMVRAAIRGLLRVVDATLSKEIRAALRREDDYKDAGKPVCDWEDAVARDALVDALAKDGYAALLVLDGKEVGTEVAQAGALLATVLGQDLEQTEGRFRIARRVAPDRVISTVDPEARHGHKTQARGFDGYKGHIAIDPDSEIVTATEVTAGNVADGVVAETLVGTELAEAKKADANEPVEIYGDASYGTADLVEKIEAAGAEANVKVQAPSPPRVGLYSQDAFKIDTQAGTACCPAGTLVKLRVLQDGAAVANFSASCTSCPLRTQCTASVSGRELRIHPKYATLVRSRARQRDPEWRQRYRATRPKVERKIGHLMRRRHGGRRARVRGREKIRCDFALLAAAINLARLAVLGVG